VGRGIKEKKRYGGEFVAKGRLVNKKTVHLGIAEISGELYNLRVNCNFKKKKKQSNKGPGGVASASRAVGGGLKALGFFPQGAIQPKIFGKTVRGEDAGGKKHRIFVGATIPESLQKWVMF